jgi:spore maturation protein CgeB
MKIIYIGQYSEGTTSKMRADQIASIVPGSTFNVIDIHVPFYKSHRLFRSLGARYKIGPLLWNINSYINKHLTKDYDLIWVDKGVFISKNTLLNIRSKAKTLIHYTPDMAFYANKTSKFISNMDTYNYLVTTKSAELSMYEKVADANKIILVKQGYDLKVHKAYYSFEEKEDYISFIGLYEPSRGEIVQKIIDQNIHVKVAGNGWLNFVTKNKNNPYFTFVGNGLFSSEYSKFISKSIMSLGLLSKNFPEFHTTRTFEIPACNTALITEVNNETSSFYKTNEAIFYNDTNDLIEKIEYFIKNKQELKEITLNGNKKVISSGCDYKSILQNILVKASIIHN